MSRRVRLTAQAVWLLLVLGLLAVLVLERLFMCELVPGSSLFGEASYSVLGRTCTYELQGLTYVQSPPFARLVLGVLLIVWPVGMSAAARRRREAGRAVSVVV